MKKKTKKLVLAKETVRSLSAVDLVNVAGGSWQATCACGTGQCWSDPAYSCQDEFEPAHTQRCN
jgi:hypothetical protein